MLNTMQCLDRLNGVDEILDAEPSYDIGYDTPITCDSCHKQVDKVYEFLKDAKLCSDCVAEELFELENKLVLMFRELNLNIKAGEVVDYIDNKVRG